MTTDPNAALDCVAQTISACSRPGAEYFRTLSFPERAAGGGLSGIDLTKVVGDEQAPPVQQVLNLGDGCEIVFQGIQKIERCIEQLERLDIPKATIEHSDEDDVVESDIHNPIRDL